MSEAAASEPGADAEMSVTRRMWLAVLAKARVDELEAAREALADKPHYRVLRRAETGLAMLRSRIGSTGQPFNFSEMMTTWAAIQPLDVAGDANQTGFGHVAGRSAKHAELVALFDALLQDTARHDVLAATLVAQLGSAGAATGFGGPASTSSEERGMSPIDQIFECFDRHGADGYGGERVRQLEHALQCAALAEAEGAAATLIAAALLHDVGHLIHGLGDSPAARGIDDRHELRGREWLARWFGEAVTEPVRLHVNAKRYLTATDPGYFATLSAGSVRSLELQGGPFSPELAVGFIGLPFAPEAVRLRRWDEAAKLPGKPTRDLAHFRRYLEVSLNAA